MSLNLSSTVRSERFTFDDLREVFAKAGEAKSGDQLAGLAARSERERVAAKRVLAELTLAEIVDHPLIDPDIDEVTRLILDTQDKASFAAISTMTVGEFREFLLDDRVEEADLKTFHQAITPEIAAATAKLLSNKDLIIASSKIRVISRCRNTIGERGVISVRVQPNHPRDDLGGILLSTIDGLLLGGGDAMIGVNPVAESVEGTATILRALNRLIEAYGIPTQACCLAHISTQLQAMEKGAPVDLLFQSVAGTEAANAGFGISLATLREGLERVREHHKTRDVHWVGEQAMYFETGQGSALSSGTHHGVDQLTLEARAYGVARAFDPFLVNSVVGFIGPEYLRDERQITRAGLEDHFMGKLLGLPMGVDVCYTNHADADQNSADNLLVLLAAAGCNFVIGVTCAGDVMLNHQSVSYHDIAGIRKLLGLNPAPEFLDWLQTRGIYQGTALRSAESPMQARMLQEITPILEAVG